MLLLYVVSSLGKMSSQHKIGFRFKIGLSAFLFSSKKIILIGFKGFRLSGFIAEKTKNTNNMILCKKCGYHVPVNEICGTKKEIDMCQNRK